MDERAALEAVQEMGLIFEKMTASLEDLHATLSKSLEKQRKRIDQQEQK